MWNKTGATVNGLVDNDTDKETRVSTLEAQTTNIQSSSLTNGSYSSGVITGSTISLSGVGTGKVMISLQPIDPNGMTIDFSSDTDALAVQRNSTDLFLFQGPVDSDLQNKIRWPLQFIDEASGAAPTYRVVVDAADTNIVITNVKIFAYEIR